MNLTNTINIDLRFSGSEDFEDFCLRVFEKKLDFNLKGGKIPPEARKEENSSVYGILLDSGLLDGTVRIDDEEYFVEPAKNYFSPLQHFHSVVYRLSDIKFPETNRTCLKSVIKKSDCQHVKHSNRSNKSSLYRKDDQKLLKSLQRLVNKHQRLDKRRKRLHKHSHNGKRHGTKQARGHHSRKKSKMFHHDSDIFENFEYFKNDVRNFPKYSSKFSVNSKHRFEQWFGDSTRPAHDYDISANRESSSSSSFYENTFENQTSIETFTFPSNRTDRAINGFADGTTPSGTTTARSKPEVFLEDTHDVPYWRELDALHYTEDGRTGSSEPYGVRSIQRTQWNEDRGQRHVAVDRRKSTCLLYLQADHLFYQRMGSEEACIDAMTRHVQRVNSIYRTTGT
ncbi:uncharacterized protein NPIL_410191 [Nephila pilipes]|uniref:Uncharacterized protein n=1 Tax=Nephila pilipes TaxID=299642 RepID=A0A8X6NEU1_NEPPI|nr:uncharacterized protein NPIL_410191 [Nephila pilipes]